MVRTDSATGYVLDGRHVLELMLDHLNLPDRIQIEQTLTIFDERFDSGRKAIRQTISYKIPGGFRSEAETEDRRRIYLAAGDKTLTVVDGKIISQSSEALVHYKDLFCYRHRKSLADHLRCLGINVSMSSYGRQEETIVYVIGAQYPDSAKPQIWVEKSNFLPTRWFYQPANSAIGQDRIEFRYKNWQQREGRWYPYRIEIFKNDGLIRKIEAHRININPIFSDDFFNIDHLKAVYTAPVIEGRKPGSENDINHQIEKFREIFEPDR